MTSKHTPGPWQSRHDFDREGRLQIIGDIDGPDDGDYHYTRICVVDDEESDDEVWANARLIAAAPDLLEAAKNLRGRFYSALIASGSSEWAADAACGIIDAAIAKATGEGN